MFRKSPNKQNKGASFFEAVYRVVRAIPVGRAMTYAGVARRAGSAGAFRAVGNAMRKNRSWPAVPCHRVIPSSGLLGGWSGVGGPKEKKTLLISEGIKFSGDRIEESCIIR